MVIYLNEFSETNKNPQLKTEKPVGTQTLVSKSHLNTSQLANEEKEKNSKTYFKKYPG